MTHENGTYVYVPTRAKSSQPGFVTRRTKTGKVKIRVFNRAKEKWMPRERIFTEEQVNRMEAMLPRFAGLLPPLPY